MVSVTQKCHDFSHPIYALKYFINIALAFGCDVFRITGTSVKYMLLSVVASKSESNVVVTRRASRTAMEVSLRLKVQYQCW